MSFVVSVIAPGAMGSAIGIRLLENAAEVRTSLIGRSETSVVRAKAAGMISVDDELIASSDVILSIVPPSEAIKLAERLSPALKSTTPKPFFIDCNAVSPLTAAAVGDIVTATGSRYVDGCIIGLPPKPGAPGPTLYFSGEHAREAMVLARFGLNVRALDAPIGAASALKMSYAGITKGLTGLAAATILAASQAGAGAALREELQNSQPALLDRFSKVLPDMYSKAYRWVAEMQEISQFSDNDPGTRAIYGGFALLFDKLAQDYRGNKVEIGAIEAFLNLA